MGAVNLGFPEEYSRTLKELYKLDVFVESGTLYGGTAKASAAYFKKVFTIEKSSDFYEIARESLKPFSQVEVIHGDSVEVLPNILLQWDNILFWLDAHWSGTVEGKATAGEEKECPLLEELEIITTLGVNKNYVIAIDDARLFTAPPPRPHDFKQWPDLAEIMGYVSDGFRAYIIDDIIFFTPEKEGDAFILFLQNVVTARNVNNRQVAKNFFCRGLEKIKTIFCP